ISSNVAGRDLGSVVEDIRAAVAQSVPMPAGYRVEYGGQFESQQSATRRLMILGVGVIAGLFMLLVLAFGRARDALLIMVNPPLALIPLALSGGKTGSEIQTPMAIVILCGLVSSTFLNMMVVPAMYLEYGAYRKHSHQAGGGSSHGPG